MDVFLSVLDADACLLAAATTAAGLAVADAGLLSYDMLCSAEVVSVNILCSRVRPGQLFSLGPDQAENFPGRAFTGPGL